MKAYRFLNCFSLICLCGALSVLLTSCAIAEARSNRQKLKNIRVGMTQEDVKAIMGDPLNESYSTKDIWFYYSQNQWFDGMVTRDECTPLVFDEFGKLQGWGQDYYKKNCLLPEWKAEEK